MVGSLDFSHGASFVDPSATGALLDGEFAPGGYNPPEVVLLVSGRPPLLTDGWLEASGWFRGGFGPEGDLPSEVMLLESGASPLLTDG